MNRRIVIPAAAAIVVGVFLIASSLSHGHPTGGNSLPIATSINYLLSISNGTLQVDAHSYTFYHFSAPDESSNAQVHGDYTMAGNGSNIGIYLLDEGNFTNWKNGHQFTAYYESDHKTTDTISINVPSGKILYLVYDNSHSVISSKVVSSKLYLLYK